MCVLHINTGNSIDDLPLVPKKEKKKESPNNQPLSLRI